MVNMAKIQQAAKTNYEAVEQLAAPAAEEKGTLQEAQDNLWNEFGATIMENTNVNEEVARSYTNYAASTLFTEDANANGGLDLEEWSGNERRYGFLGLEDGDKQGLEDIFNGMDANGDGRVDARELIAVARFKDIADKDGNYDDKTKAEADGNLNVEVSEEGKTDMARNMQILSKQEGKDFITGMLYDTLGHNTAYSYAISSETRAALSENVRNGEITQEKVNTIANNLQEYIEATLVQKDGKDGEISKENWINMGGTLNALGLENSQTGRQDAAEIFDAIDLDGNGMLDINELATQWLYRDQNSNNELDGIAHIGGNAMAGNLTNIIKEGKTTEERRNFLLDNFAYNFGFIEKEEKEEVAA